MTMTEAEKADRILKTRAVLTKVSIVIDEMEELLDQIENSRLPVEDTNYVISWMVQAGQLVDGSKMTVNFMMPILVSDRIMEELEKNNGND
jgi:hypothetical protein